MLFCVAVKVNLHISSKRYLNVEILIPFLEQLLLKMTSALLKPII